jgi:tetratricopeptide (TPR) repeat protein
LIEGGAARHGSAQEHLEQALAVIDEAGLELPRTSVLTRLGYIQTLAGEFEAALATLDASIEATYRTFGPQHPRTGLAHNLRGHTLLAHGRPREALPDLDTARGILEADASPLKPDLADVLTNLASARLALHEPAEALQLFRDAQALYAAHGGPRAVRVGSVLNDISDALLELGRADAALAAAREAQEIFAEHYGPEHPQMAQAIESAGTALHAKGQLQEALEHFRRGKQIRAASLGEEHVDLAYSFERIGRVLVDLGEHAEAVESLETAARLWRRALPASHPRIAQTEFELARALWSDPASRARALDLARAAAIVLAKDERADPRARENVEAWLRERD